MIQGVSPDVIQKFIKTALYEDVRDGDHTSLACIPEDSVSKARLLVKDTGILAGVSLAVEIFKYVDPNAKIDIRKPDGSDVFYGDEAFYVECNSRALLKAERLVLNSMQRMSGIATLTSRFKLEVKDTGATLLDTRKTTPLIRFLEKWAVRIGGGSNYRDGLYDWIMIKDNHIDACGGIVEAIDAANDYLQRQGMDLNITIEVRNLVELHKVLNAGNVKRIMLDNFELPLLHEAVKTIGDQYDSEASGGVNLKTVRDIALTGVDYISIGALTHSAGSLDMSLKIMKD